MERVGSIPHLPTYLPTYYFFSFVDTYMLMEGIVSLRATFFEMSSLDMAQFLSIPGFSFEFMLRHTQTEIGLVSDPDMFKIFERQMRGGLSFASNRYLRLSKQQRQSESVILADLNNQYGYSLMQRLPIGDYRWEDNCHCLLYTSPSPRDRQKSRMPSSA